MKARSVRTISIAILRSWKRISKTALLTLVFLFVVVGNVGSAFADSYPNYEQLFNGPYPISSLKKLQFVDQNTSDVNLKFQFQSSFKLDLFQAAFGNDNPKKKESAWDHIRDAEIAGGLNNPSSKKMFIIRICDTSETNCYFSPVPYSRKRAGGFLSAVQISATEPTDKIYHYGNDGAAGGTDQQDKFNVVFSVPTLATIDDGDYDNEKDTEDVLKFGDTKQYKADIWYCIGETQMTPAEPFPTQDNPNEPQHRQFDNLCGDNHPYFKIATSEPFTIPTSAAAAQTETPVAPTAANTTSESGDGLPTCSITNWTVAACMARLIYYAIYWPISWLAGVMGTIFDFFLGYSLDDASFRAEFAVKGWQLVRDISNIFFIIILVYTGLMTVFSGKSNMKQVLPNLILNALLINFSLFGTRVVIDISNITARVFYNSVNVCKGECEKDSDGKITNFLTGPAGYKSLSTKIMSSFNPQTIFNAQVLAGGAQVGGAQGTTSKRDPVSDHAGYFIIVTVLASLLLFGIAMMFWKVAFMFLGRVVGLYVAMIFAPFAVLTRGNMPLVGNIKDLSWDSWLKDLTNYALLAPIFVFFLYIIYSFLNSGFLKINFGDLNNADFFITIVSVAVPMLMVYLMIDQGVKIAKKYAGVIGEKFQEYGQKAAGFVGGAALGVATGGAALAGRNILGRAGSRIAESQTLQNAASSGRWYSRLADRTMRVGTGMSTSTYDARNTSAGRRLQQESGINLDNGLVRAVGTGTNRTQGGFREAITRNERYLTERADRFQLRGAAAVAQDGRNRAWENAYQTRRTAAETAAMAAGNAFDETAFRAQDLTTQAAAGNARAQTTAEVNRGREVAYQAALTRGTFLSRIAQSATNRVTAPGAGTGAVAAASGAVATGVGMIGAAAAVGQGAIQGAARQNVINSRQQQARAPLSPGQTARLQARLTQLGQDRLRLQTTLGPVVPGAGVATIDDLTVLDVQNYQAAHAGHNMPSPNTVIAERNRVNSEITNIRTQLGLPT